MMVGVYVVAALAGVALGVGAVYVGWIAIEGIRRDRRLRPGQAVQARQQDHWQRLAAMVDSLAGKLDSEDAAERLAGLGELERCGRENPDVRHEVIEQTCAYLRRPFRFPVEDEEEFEIRRTAQGLLTRHLRRSGGADFWDVEELDLRDAVLVEPDFEECDLSDADFRDGVIVGGNFRRARFWRFANFDRTWFTGDTDFRAAVFPRVAGFSGAMFSGTTTFAEAEFESRVDFDGARVEQPDAAHSWPSPWRPWVNSPVAHARLIPMKTDRRPPSAAERRRS
ncbi:pentapeptide repeat-containing protein [Amycolatopsis sp. NPDC089917]|uniref:pentapeptide repeat-containing protein n=1 Tax=Amycolatopsis sp. NPDC089917 TaxID=3155187 RepID=UPI003442C1C8